MKEILKNGLIILYIGIELGIDSASFLLQNVIVSIVGIIITTMVYVVVWVICIQLMIVFVGKRIHVLNEGVIKY